MEVITINNYKEQSIVFYTVNEIIELLKDKENINYKTIGIKLHQKFILSQVMYLKSEVVGHSYRLFVQKNTYDKRFQKIIDYLLEDIVVIQSQLGNSNITIIAHLRKAASFVNWSQAENINILGSKNSALEAYGLYTKFLKDSIKKGLSQGDASIKHAAALKLLKSIHLDRENYISSGIRAISNLSTYKYLEKSDEHKQKYQFKFFNMLFNQISDFLLEQKKYPYQLILPNGNVWILPSSKTFFPENKKSPLRFFCENGRIRSESESIKLHSYSPSKVIRRDRRLFLDNIKKNNDNGSSNKRLILGSIAIKAYFMHFLAITGMNDSTAATLAWNDEYEVLSDRQSYKNIKARAANKLVEFQIQSKFINNFKKFLKLRNFVLNGNSVESLFFARYGEKSALSKIQSLGVFSNNINNYMIKFIDSKLPRIGSRQLRVNKTHQVIKNSGILAASQVAQSSINTILKCYTGESQESADIQLTNFYKKLNQSLILKTNNGTVINIGQCKSMNNPKTEITLKGVEVDCKQSEGCLFCEQYGCHADETDIRKLFSLLYIINECEYIASNEEHFNSVYKVIIERISEIIGEIRKSGKVESVFIDQIKNDVFKNENLHPYWEHKLEILISMGILK